MCTAGRPWRPFPSAKRLPDGSAQGLVPRSSRHDLDQLQPSGGPRDEGVHPLVVLSPREFNERTGIVIRLPMPTAALEPLYLSHRPMPAFMTPSKARKQRLLNSLT